MRFGAGDITYIPTDEGWPIFGISIRPNVKILCLKQLKNQIQSMALGDTIVCDELVKAIEGVTTNGKTKLQQG